MDVCVKTGDLAQFAADAVIVNLFEGITQPGGATGAVDAAMGNVISQELEHGQQFKGKLGETLVFPTYGKIPARYIVIVGLGKSESFKSKQLRRAAAAAIRACGKLSVKTVASVLHGAGIGNVDAEAAARLTTEGTLLGLYKFTQRKTTTGQKNPELLGTTIETITIVEQDGDKLPAIEAGIKTGKAVADATNQVRDWVNDSANYVTPTFLAEAAQSLQGGSITCKVLDQPQLEAEGMRTFLSVSKGSAEPPKLIHLTYKPAGTPRKKVTLVGKGITFDSGGISLKPSSGGIEWMKTDMTGAGVIIGVIHALAALGNLDIQVDAIAPCCENMPSGTANKPGDIITSMNGKTIEINNTDAEGRLVLADALTYAQKYVAPDELIDLATLTGAAISALGKEASAIMGTDETLLNGIRAAGENAGERYWPLPLFDEFKDMLKSDVADMINAGSKGQAGTSAGGTFLKEFIDDGQKWVHLDIAGPSYTDRDVPEVPKGCTGVGVRTLLYYLYGWSETETASVQ